MSAHVTDATVKPRVHVFAGPTLGPTEVRTILPSAQVYPPIEHGAVLRLPIEPGDIVVIIDGTFYQATAVRHKELMYLIGRGVTVSGASSMGALRAAELAPLGMHGYGYIYRLFRYGVLERDDEVAVAHSTEPEAFRPLSDALVNVRFAARRARRCGVLKVLEERLIVDIAAALPFAARRHSLIAKLALERGLPAAASEGYLRFATTDIKRTDAEGLLRLVAAGALPAGSPPLPPPYTTWLADWLHDALTIDVDGAPVSEADALSCCALFAEDYVDVRAEVLLRLMAGDTGQSAAVLPALAVAAARERGLLPGYPGELPVNLLPWLAPEERACSRDAAVLKALVRSFRYAPGTQAREPVLEALRATGAVRHGSRIAAAAVRLNAELMSVSDRYNPEHVPDGTLRDWFAQRWRTDDMRLALLDRGFGSEAEFRRRARTVAPLAVLHGVEPFSVRTPPSSGSESTRDSPT